MTAAVRRAFAAQAGGGARLARALALAAPGATVALPPGVYREAPAMTRAVTVEAQDGPGSVVIEVPPGSTLLVADGEIRLRGLVIRGGGERLPLIRVVGGRLRMDGCELRATAAMALHLHGGRTRMFGGRIGNSAGAGVVVEAGVAELVGVALAGIGGAGLIVSGGAMPILRGCAFTDVEGVGVLAAGTGAALLERCRISSLSSAAVLAREDCRLRIVRSLVEGGRVGLYVADRARPTVENCRFRDTAGPAVVTVDRAAPSLVECVVDSPAGHGLHASGRSAAEIQRCAVRGSAAAGVVVDGGAHPTFLGGEIAGCGDVGVLLLGGSTAWLDGVRVHGSPIGVSIEGAAAPRLVGLDIGDVDDGIRVRDSAHPRLSLSRVHATSGAALVLGPGTRATVTDTELVGDRGPVVPVPVPGSDPEPDPMAIPAGRTASRT
ncbi:right-handed parallel beta-helix repeat-containing protein [Frankia gtarii]|uniref:right-handed parallel beta-helix repeat-containing protein n=1 Tax=Frankia gtarii TaxID=2950102 RepID=UPI0021BF6A32|nr:right-handed parallel beta-helix repeat-containing protein [Frankia gtarii]